MESLDLKLGLSSLRIEGDAAGLHTLALDSTIFVRELRTTSFPALRVLKMDLVYPGDLVRADSVPALHTVVVASRGSAMWKRDYGVDGGDGGLTVWTDQLEEVMLLWHLPVTRLVVSSPYNCFFMWDDECVMRGTLEHLELTMGPTSEEVSALAA